MRVYLYFILCLNFLVVFAVNASISEKYSTEAEESNFELYTFFIGGCHIPIPIEMSINGTQEAFKFYDSRNMFDEEGSHRTITASNNFNVGESSLFVNMGKQMILSNGEYQLIRYTSSELKVTVYMLTNESDYVGEKSAVMFHNFRESDVVFSYKFCITHKEFKLEKNWGQEK